MKANAIPVTTPVVWGSGAGGSYIRQVPNSSQIGIQDGAASWTDGYVPLNMTPKSLGGVPPFGQDMNGVLNQISAWVQWVSQAGVPATFDNGFSTAIGGYPEGAYIQSAVTNGLYFLCTADDNTTNPDSGGNHWLPIWPRFALLGDQTFFVSTTGNDGNTGLTSGQAWATLQHAYDYIQSRYDLNGFQATVQMADGTYAANVNCNGPLLGQTGQQALLFASASGNTAACIISVNDAGGCFTASHGASVGIQNVKLVNAGGPGLNALDGGSIFHSGLEFGACSTAHIIGTSNTLIASGNNYKISGAAANHINVANGGQVRQTGGTITVTGTPAFTTFALATDIGRILFQAGAAFSGSATGTRYSGNYNAGIQTGGGGASFFPGNSAGSVANGAYYA